MKSINPAALAIVAAPAPAASYIPFRGAAIDRTIAAYAETAIQTPILVDGELTDASALAFSLGMRVTFR